MKKLLVISPQNPYPAKDGGKISIYYPLIHLTETFEVHFAFFTLKEVTWETYDHFTLHNVRLYPLIKNTTDQALGYILNIASALPYKFQKYTSRKILKRLDGICQKEGITTVWCNHAHVAWYGLQLNKSRGVNIFLREHNIEYSLVKQVMHVLQNPFIKAFVWYQFIKTRKFEIRCWKMFRTTFFISDSDFALAQKSNINNKCVLLYDSTAASPVAAGAIKNQPVSQVDKEPYSFIFTANIDSFQNYYNLKKFIFDIWKPLIAKDNRWKLYITGNERQFLETKLKSNLDENNIICLGIVNDIQEVVSSKKYFISPTYIGSGLRIKVLNALAQGEVCFVTLIDLMMLKNLRDEDNIVQYDGFDSFYYKLLLLENNTELYNKISLGAKLVGTSFSWSNYVDIIYNEISKVEGFTGR